MSRELSVNRNYIHRATPYLVNYSVAHILEFVNYLKVGQSVTILSSGTLILAFFLAYKLNWPIISKAEAEEEKAREEIEKTSIEAETAKRDVQEARNVVKAELEGKK